MEQIFESQCDEETRTVAFRSVDSGERIAGAVAIMTGPPTASFCLMLEREDAESLARAILGMQDPPFVEWDACAAEMKADAANVAVVRRAVAEAWDQALDTMASA